MHKKETARLRKVISKFRTFARDSDDIFKPVHLSEVLQNTFNLMNHQLKIKGVDFKMQSTDHLPPVYGDKNGLQQVFLNLISNAMDALEDKPRGERNIHIKASADKDLIHIVVADNGAGIPEDIQQSIFDPFFTTKGVETGTGLGLSIIGTILQKHKATINVSSQVNQGTSFTISFPIFHEDSSARAPSATA